MTCPPTPNALAHTKEPKGIEVNSHSVRSMGGPAPSIFLFSNATDTTAFFFKHESRCLLLHDQHMAMFANKIFGMFLIKMETPYRSIPHLLVQQVSVRVKVSLPDEEMGKIFFAFFFLKMAVNGPYRAKKNKKYLSCCADCCGRSRFRLFRRT